MFVRLLIAFLIFLVIFAPLERLFPLHSQKFFRQGWWVDLIHFFVSQILLRLIVPLAVIALLPVLKFFVNLELQSWVASQPIGLQFLEAIFLQEIGAYWAHRLLHSVPWLWKFHAVHHSSEQLDWLVATRLHPLDQTFTRICGFIPLYLLGFSKGILATYAIFTTFNAIFIHANVRFRFGPLKWIVATPEFHRWHHCNDPEIYDKNLAGTFPVVDLVFGTLYLPSDRRPERYGIGEPMPNSYLGQLAYPFVELAKQGKVIGNG
ncbi:MAG: sterol desaturase family protein [Cyanobacteriota bacterium]|nr:sterol desaturase family protein [Cyanobacteriota bacterium]